MISTTWKVTVGPVAAPVNYTSRMVGLTVDQQLRVNTTGTQRATVTLRNQDGALTPGGGGTYGSTDWFQQGMWIYAVTDTGSGAVETLVFAGVVDRFDLADDSTESTVTLGAVDGWSVISRTNQVAVPAYSGANNGSDFETQMDTDVHWDFAWPLLGKTSGFGSETYLTALPAYARPLQLAAATSPVTRADYITNTVLPTQTALAWSGNITSSASQVTYDLYIIRRTLNRTANVVDYTFTGTAGTSTTLPFTSLQQAWTNGQVINTATYTHLGNNTTNTAANDTSQARYGSRSITNRVVAIPGVGTSTVWLPWVTDKATQPEAEMVQRYGTARFLPVTLTTKASTVAVYATDAAVTYWRNLLSLRDGLWQRADVTWTGTGATSQTAIMRIVGRRITATVHDTTVTISLASFVDNSSWVVGTSALDTHRLA